MVALRSGRLPVSFLPSVSYPCIVTASCPQWQSIEDSCQDDCRFSELDRRGVRWPALSGRRRFWLAGHGQPGWKPSFQAQSVQPAVDEGGEYLARNPGRRSMWMSSSRLRSFTLVEAVLNAPVIAEQPEQLLRAAMPGTQAGQQIPTNALCPLRQLLYSLFPSPPYALCHRHSAIRKVLDFVRCPVWWMAAAG